MDARLDPKRGKTSVEGAYVPNWANSETFASGIIARADSDAVDPTDGFGTRAGACCSLPSIIESFVEEDGVIDVDEGERG